jgi:protein SCO1
MKTLICFLFAVCSTTVLGASTIVGKVISEDPSQQQMTLALLDADAQNPIAVKVGEGDGKVGYVGRIIRGELVTSDGMRMLERIWPADPDEEAQMRAVNQILRADTAVRQKREFRKVGDYGIHFALWDQEGKLFQFNQTRGNWVVLNFIFTRCKVAEMCPAQTARMVDLQQQLVERGLDDVQLFSVSLDPEFDTPGILNQYAEMKGADQSMFRFLTGPKEVVMDLLKQYGVIAFESSNIIDHTVTTLLFDPTGRIQLRRDGTRWQPRDILTVLERASQRD